MMNNGAIAWATKKVRIVPDSTAEAETAAASRAAKDTVAVRMRLGDLRAEVHGPTPMLAWRLSGDKGYYHKTGKQSTHPILRKDDDVCEEIVHDKCYITLTDSHGRHDSRCIH